MVNLTRRLLEIYVFVLFLGINVTITETDRFETLCLYYDMGNLTIITTHNVKLYFLALSAHINLIIIQTDLMLIASCFNFENSYDDIPKPFLKNNSHNMNICLSLETR
jgi:hypothetical protein